MSNLRFVHNQESSEIQERNRRGKAARYNNSIAFAEHSSPSVIVKRLDLANLFT